MRYSAVLFCLFVTAAMAAKNKPKNKIKGHKLIVLSMGAINRGMIKNSMPRTNKHFGELATAKYLLPIMPNKGSVNNFSIATGLYADGHGVIDDCEYDEPKGKCNYGRPNVENIKPIWIENHEAGGASAVMNWPGSKLNYLDDKINPTQIDDIQENVRMQSCEEQGKARANMIFDALRSKKNNLVMAYYDEIDKMLHESHTENDQEKKFECADYFIDSLISPLLKKKSEYKDVTLIVLGSHGVRTVGEFDGIQLDDILTECPFVAMGANAIVSPKSGKLEEVYEILKNNAQTTQKKIKYHVYYQWEIPEEWHIKEMSLFNNKIYLVANIGYFFWNYYHEEIFLKQHSKFKTSVDGYFPNDSDDSNPIFMAVGPMFKRKTQVSAFNTIEVYALLRDLLELPEGDNVKMSEDMRSLFREDNNQIKNVICLPDHIIEKLDGAMRSIIKSIKYSGAHPETLTFHYP